MMRDFQDENGVEWSANVTATEGPDYKGRYHLTLTNGAGEVVELVDIEWNTARTAERTLETMSMNELRKRLRSAKGRAAGV